MTETELNVLSRQCLADRIEDKPALVGQIGAWKAPRNGQNAKVQRRFFTADARIKLRRLYPSVQVGRTTSAVAIEPRPVSLRVFDFCANKDSMRFIRRLSSVTRGAADRYDLTMLVLLFGLLAFMPLSLGGVEAWSRLIFFSVVTGLTVCLAAKLVFCQSAKFVWSWSYIPMLLFIGFTALQMVPLPASMVNRLSPQTLIVKTQLTGDISGPARTAARTSLSFYPYATGYDLRLVLAASAVFVVVLNVFRAPKQIKQLLTAITFVGGVVAAIALVQDFTNSLRIFRVIPLPSGGKANGGTFVNHSHFAQFMNLSIGAAIALLLVQLAERLPHREASHSHKSHRIIRGSNDRAVAVSQSLGWIVLVVVGGALSIVLSLSRGGIIAMLAAGVGTAFSLTVARRGSGGRGSLLAILGLIVFVCVLYLGFEPIYNRFATRQDIDSYGGRGQILKDLMILCRQFPLVGTGLGTHAVVFPMVDRSIAAQTAAYAENDYAQLLEETGIVGVISAVFFIAALLGTYIHCIRRRESISWAGFGLGFGLGAVMLHSLSDFGQHIPANALLSAVTCGLLFCTLRASSNSNQPAAVVAKTVSSPIIQPSNLPHWSGVALVALFAGAMASALPGAFAASSAIEHWNLALKDAEILRRARWQGGNDIYEDLIGEAWLASDAEPSNVFYRYRLNEFRWRALSRGMDNKTGWHLTPQMAVYVQGIVEELHQARRICPTYGSAAGLAGQLEWYILGIPAGKDHIRMGYRLSSQDAAAAFVTGLLEASEKNWAESVRALRRAVALDSSMLPDAMQIFVEVEDRPDLAIDIADGKPESLLQFADGLDRGGVHEDWSDRARDRAFALLEQRCSAADASSGELLLMAELYLKKEEPRRAIDLYRRALVSAYGSADLHLRLARLLADDGQGSAARKEARISLHLNPANREAKELIGRLPPNGGIGSGEK